MVASSFCNTKRSRLSSLMSNTTSEPDMPQRFRSPSLLYGNCIDKVEASLSYCILPGAELAPTAVRFTVWKLMQ